MPTENSITDYKAGQQFFNHTSEYHKAVKRSKDFKDPVAFLDGWLDARETHHFNVQDVLDAI
jgi:hypothetical protein